MSCNLFRDQSLENERLNIINDISRLENERLEKANDKDRIYNEKLVLEIDRFRAETERGAISLDAKHRLKLKRFEILEKLYSKQLDTLSPCLKQAKKTTENIGYFSERLKITEELPSEHCRVIISKLNNLLIKEEKDEKGAMPGLADHSNKYK